MNLSVIALPWMSDARCKGSKVHFPGPGDIVKMREAKAICRDCPVRAACLEYAIHVGEPSGVWGGMSARERQRSVGKTGLPYYRTDVTIKGSHESNDQRRGSRRVPRAG